MKNKIQNAIALILFGFILIFNIYINISNPEISQTIDDSLECIVNQARADSEGYCPAGCTGYLCPNGMDYRYIGSTQYCCVRNTGYTGSACPD